MKRAKLPAKPSGLIRVALADMKKVIKKPDVKINMGEWVRPRLSYEEGAKTVCEVCFAGSVMMNTFGPQVDANGGYVSGPDELSIHPRDIRGLRALNEFRQGDIQDGIRALKNTNNNGEYLPWDERQKINDYAEKIADQIPRDVKRIGEYKDTPAGNKRFRKKMFRLARALEKIGQ